MKINNNIQDKINNTLYTSEAIEQVNVSHFFKEKTMQRLFAEKKDEQTIWSWFTPKLQLATLACVVILNAFTLIKLQETTYNENVNQFAESYGLSTSTETSLLN